MVIVVQMPEGPVKVKEGLLKADVNREFANCRTLRDYKSALERLGASPVIMKYSGVYTLWHSTSFYAKGAGPPIEILVYEPALETVSVITSEKTKK